MKALMNITLAITGLGGSEVGVSLSSSSLVKVRERDLQGNDLHSQFQSRHHKELYLLCFLLVAMLDDIMNFPLPHEVHRMVFQAHPIVVICQCFPGKR